jgi:hypothetical protein
MTSETAKLAAGTNHVGGLTDHRRLVGCEVDDAVGYDDIDASISSANHSAGRADALGGDEDIGPPPQPRSSTVSPSRPDRGRDAATERPGNRGFWRAVGLGAAVQRAAEQAGRVRPAARRPATFAANVRGPFRREAALAYVSCAVQRRPRGTAPFSTNGALATARRSQRAPSPLVSRRIRRCQASAL